MENNRRFLIPIVKYLEFCGRQRLTLGGHRDDSTPDKRQQGNFKGLLNINVDAGDQVLQEHLEMCDQKASYFSKPTQNELLECIRQYVQDQIIGEIKA